MLSILQKSLAKFSYCRVQFFEAINKVSKRLLLPHI